MFISSCARTRSRVPFSTLRFSLFRSVVSILLASASVSAAQEPPNIAAQVAPDLSPAQQEMLNARINAAAEQQAQEAIETEAENQFAGLTFGAGISATLDVGSHDRIKEAQVVNGVVRITSQENVRARVMLESHYFFLPKGSFLSVPTTMWGWGPFMALQPGTDNIIEAAAIGVMMGFRRNREDSSSFNFGIGYIVDPNVRTLGDGIIANEPLPLGETEVRYKNQEQWGLLFITSFSF